MLELLRYFFLMTLISSGLASTGSFWHVSDFHLDPRYSDSGLPSQMCHRSGNGSTPHSTGKFGNVFCDSPFSLVRSAIGAMEDLEPNPHFILWTGDNSPHEDLEWTAVLSTLNNITSQIKSAFPAVSVLPAIGNHDTFPPNILPGTGNQSALYRRYLEEGGWGRLPALQNSRARADFLKGGYYSAEPLHGGVSLTVLVLNTILWYKANPSVVTVEDPAGQMAWLERQLEEAAIQHRNVYLAGHIPPGYESNSTRFLPNFQKQYFHLVQKYHRNIAGQFFGHLHRDTFFLYTDAATGHTYGSLMAAPSITPWYSPEWPTSVPTNPGIRLVAFDIPTFRPLDFKQYYLDLARANAKGKAEWDLLYQFTQQYTGIPDLTTDSLVGVLDKLIHSDTLRDEFIRLQTVGLELPSHHPSKADTLRSMCTIAQLEKDPFKHCVRTCVQHPSSCPTVHQYLQPDAPPPSFFSGTGLGTLQLILILAAAGCVIGITLYLGRRKLRKLQEQERFTYSRF